MTTLNEINGKTHEGQLLLAALAMLTTTTHTDKTPDETLAEIEKMRASIYPDSNYEKKRLFQLLDLMNLQDSETGTANLGVCGDFIGADKVKGGAKICMGAPFQSITDIATDKVIPLLLLVNNDLYHALKKANDQKG